MWNDLPFRCALVSFLQLEVLTLVLAYSLSLNTVHGNDAASAENCVVALFFFKCLQ